MLSFLVAFHRRSFSQPLSCHWAISWSFTHCFSSLSLPAAASSAKMVRAALNDGVEFLNSTLMPLGDG